MQSWKALKKNDIVDIVAPGSGTREDELNQACQFLESWGLRPRVSKSLFSGHPYLSNSDDYRFKDLKRALYKKDSSVVWCLRGGYGSIRLIPSLLKLKKPSRAKLLIGYSDISTLHVFLTQKWKWISCHGPLLDSMGKGKYSQEDNEELNKLLFGQQSQIIFEGLTAANKQARKVKALKAAVVAGNLVTLASSIGTPCELQSKNKILVLEEIGERGYRLDRLFQQLLQSKAIQGIQALVLADFLGGQEPNGKNFVASALADFVNQASFPVFQGLKLGHGNNNRPLFLQTSTVIKKQKDFFTLINQSGVKN